MTKPYSGFIVVLDEGALGELLKSRVEEGQESPQYLGDDKYQPMVLGPSDTKFSKSTFTMALSAGDIDAKESEVFLISFDGESLTHAALAKKGKRIVTGKNSVSFSHVVEFAPVDLDLILNGVKSKLRQFITFSSARGGHRIPPATWKEILKVLQEHAPGALQAVDRLSSLRSFGFRVRRTEAYKTVAEEKDAVGLSLEMSGFDRKQELTVWSPPTGDEPAPFLDGMNPINLLEDQMIGYDSNVFGDWVRSLSHQVNAVEFRRHDAKLTVLNVNRTPIEATLGVDLIYYHHRYKAFVMVQYKRLKSDGNDKESVFRLSEKNYIEEVARMRAFMEQHGTHKPGEIDLDMYRLHEIPFYFKFCSNTAFDPNNAGLLKGMYIPLDYWSLLESSDSTLGSQGGRYISYRNAGRFLSNSLFTTLVGSGFVGSRASVTDAISAYIRECYESGRSVVLADYRPSNRHIIDDSRPATSFDAVGEYDW